MLDEASCLGICLPTDLFGAVVPYPFAKTKAITDFVKAYNDISTYLSQQTKYDPDTKTAGTLQGDGATLSLKNQLRSAITFPSSRQ